MKRINYLFLGLAGLALTGCSQDDVFAPGDNGDGTANVTLSVGLPKIQTRTFSDGLTSTKLQYQVYEVKGSDDSKSYTKIDMGGTETMEGLHKKMTFKLLTDHTYALVFWAQADDEKVPYTVKFDENGATLDIDYNSTICNDEKLDAFFKTEEFKITGNIEKSIELKRPFAQINVGTNDLEEAKKLGYNDVYSYFEISGHNHLDLITGTSTTKQSNGSLVTSLATRKFQYAAIPSVDEVFPVDGYDYFSMVYVLAPEDATTGYVTIKYKNGTNGTEHKSATLSEVPIQRNHRTNLFGQVLTSNADLDVYIEPIYDLDDHNYSELLFAAKVGGSATLTDDVTSSGSITFNKDAVIDLNNHEIKSTGSGKNVIVKPGDGESANVTFKNGTIQDAENATDKAAVSIEGSSPTEVTFDNMNITGVQGIWLENPNSVVYIKSGNYTTDGDGQAVYVGKDGGKFIITGGTFGTKGQTIQYLLNIYDETRKGKDPREFILVKGGTYINWNPADNTSEGQHTNFVAEGYTVVESKDGNDTLYTVVPASAAVATDVNEFKGALKNVKNGDVIVVNGKMASNITDSDMPSNVSFTIKGVGADQSAIIFDYLNSNGSSITIEDLTLGPISNSTNHTSSGFKGTKNVTLNNCTVAAEFHTWDGNTTFNNCKFIYNATSDPNNKGRYAGYVRGGEKIVFNNCVFDYSDYNKNSDGKSKGILVYSSDGRSIGDVEINNCQFIGQKDKTGENGNAAVEIHSELNTKVGTVKINNTTYDAEGYKGGLWREINNVGGYWFNVYVDGKQVQAAGH